MFACRIRTMSVTFGYGKRVMFAVVRSYSGSGSSDVINMAEEHKKEIEGVFRAVSGFVSYTLFKTDTGLVSIALCQDKAGVDEIIKIGMEWMQKNASGLDVSAPAISEGPVMLQIG